MPESKVRTGPERKAHALARLAARHAEGWVASASASGVPHLVPLSFAWDNQTVILSVDRQSVTARNLTASGRARLALGQTGDVVMIDARLAQAVSLADAPAELLQAFAGQADWDPRHAGGLPGSRDGGYVFLCLRPERIQVWRDVSEHPGRTIMRQGRWVV
jgi:general stress protein 26